MNTAQIAELLHPFLPGPLAAEQLDALSRYLDILMRWNARTNLTAVREEKNIVIRHFGESLFAAATLLGRGARDKGLCGGTSAVGYEPGGRRLSLIDVGSGAGFPGLPIKIYSPAIELTLIESQNKKATFLKEVIRSLRLPDAGVYSGRAERYARQADVVTLRAVEQFERVLPVAAGLVREPGDELEEGAEPRELRSRPHTGGRLALLIGSVQLKGAESMLPEFSWEAPVPIPLSSGRILVVGSRL